MDKSVDKTLQAAGFEPEKPVSCLTVKQLYLLIRFAAGRTAEKSNTEEHCLKLTESENKKHIESIVDYLLDYKLFIESEEYGNNAKSVQEEIDWLKYIKL